MGKTVWILGAGFSRSLGGPLLPELFGPGAESRVRTAFPTYTELLQVDAQAIREIYSAHHEQGQELWRDAEEYLDFVDTAQAGGQGDPARKLLTELLNSSRFRGVQMEGVASMARRLLVAECSAFLIGADVRSEKWQPYVRWANQLSAGDVVLSFNYDLVIEKLQRGTAARDRLQMLLPLLASDGPSNLSPDGARVSVLKLHGSMNWQLDTRTPGLTKVIADPGDDYCALNCRPDLMVIASPGPTKLTTTNGLLSALWGAAKTAIRNADAIVFLGYRFPPTDSTARRELIDAIGNNSKRYLALHTVLGMNTHSDNAERLKSMLRVAVERQARQPAHPNIAPTGEGPPYYYTLKAWPLLAEDFLDLYSVNELPFQYMRMPPDHLTD